MNVENCKRVQEAARDAGAFLDGKLPPHPGLSKRNSYAHVWERIKSKMGKSYKECSDDQVDEILAIIAWCRANP